MGEPASLGVNVLQAPEFEPGGGGQSGDGVAVAHGPAEPRPMLRPPFETDPVPAPARPGGWRFDLDDDGAVGREEVAAAAEEAGRVAADADVAVGQEDRAPAPL